MSVNAATGMRSSIIIALYLFLAHLLDSAAQTRSVTPQNLRPSDTLCSTDAKFLREAAARLRIGIGIARVGRDRARSQAVRIMADSFVMDKRRTYQELIHLAASKGLAPEENNANATPNATPGGSIDQQESTPRVTLEPTPVGRSPATDSPGRQPIVPEAPGAAASTPTMLQRLQNLPPAEFDDAFLQEAVMDHLQAIAAFGRATRECEDADVKAFATKILSVTHTQLEMAQAGLSPIGLRLTGRAPEGTKPGSSDEKKQ